MPSLAELPKLVGMKQHAMADPFGKALLKYVVVSSPQRGENAAFFSSFPLGGIHSQGILLVVPLGLQGKSINLFYGTAFYFEMALGCVVMLYVIILTY